MYSGNSLPQHVTLFLVFLDSKGKPDVSIHDGKWYVANEEEWHIVYRDDYTTPPSYSYDRRRINQAHLHNYRENKESA